MNKILVTVLGVILVSGAVSAWAGKAERQQFERCEADIVAHFGRGTRLQLRGITRDDDRVDMRIMVRVPNAGNEAVVCSRDSAGSYLLVDDEGVALLPAVGQEQLTQAR